MGQPKKQSSPRKTGLRRSHLRLELARRVNGKSPVKATATRKETGKVVKKATTKPTTDKKSTK
jgi:ribosomal protein L32